MVMPNANNLGAGTYRYGMNGMMRDNEVKAAGNSYTSYWRQYDPRLGRWMSDEPKPVAWESGYAAFRNNPIYYTDPSGDIPVGQILKNIGDAIKKGVNKVVAKFKGQKYNSVTNVVRKKAPKIKAKKVGKISAGWGMDFLDKFGRLISYTYLERLQKDIDGREDDDPRKAQKQRLSDKLYKDLQHELVFEEGEIGKTNDNVNYKRTLPEFEIEYSGGGIIHYANNKNERFNMSTKEGKNKPKLSFSTSKEVKDLANQAFESSNKLKRLDFVLSKIQPDWNDNANLNLDENGKYKFTENSFMISIVSKRKGRIQKVKKGIGGY